MTAVGLYLHWPYCLSKCPYCDFNSHVAEAIDQSRWLAAYRREIAYYAERLPDARIASIYFGGGTPSLMTPETVAGLLRTIADAWPQSSPDEITLLLQHISHGGRHDQNSRDTAEQKRKV